MGVGIRIETTFLCADSQQLLYSLKHLCDTCHKLMNVGVFLDLRCRVTLAENNQRQMATNYLQPTLAHNAGVGFPVCASLAH